jgi:hypothetical protein
MWLLLGLFLLLMALRPRRKGVSRSFAYARRAASERRS